MHDLCDHFVIYHEFVHFIVENIHLVGHRLEIKVTHLLSSRVGQPSE
jgi:hypothetical protein